MSSPHCVGLKLFSTAPWARMAQLDNSLLADGNDPKANTDNSREELFRSKVRSRWEGLVASAQVVGMALGK